MPVFTYHCDDCNTTELRLLKTKVDSLECRCGNNLKFKLPSTVSSTTYETRDKYRGVQLPKNHDKTVKQRMNNHHDRYEVAEKIDKHGLNDAKRLGWLKKNKPL